MTDLDWQQVKKLFAEALEQPADARAAHLDGRCNGNQILLDEVNSLLAAADEPESLIESNSIDLAQKIGAEADDIALHHFGNYRILREIGSGGMGAVFLAERDDGEFTMQVALKIVRQSIADQNIIERFKSERQILANLSHPNIAALHDGGVSDKGEPFLAMEYVDGETLTEYCDNHRLTIQERLRLFLKICSAVSYAHRNLVVHRDIKPSNILINRDGEPKLLDFGLAKAFDIDGSKTQTALRAFTPAYASPEQIRGGNITTASDVYSLGVVFYELLTGVKPVNVEDKSFEEIVETISNHDPIKPSSTDQDDDRGVGSKLLRGDLDNIALTAIRKEPERRFGSVEEFANDIERHLDGRPISARANTTRYIVGKFVRRNRIAVAAGVLVSLAILIGVTISLWQGAIARREAAKSDEVSTFLQIMLSTAVPESETGGKKGVHATIIDILDEATRRLDGDQLSSEPEVKAQLRQVIGEGYMSQGMYNEAERNIQAALDGQLALYGTNSNKTVKTEFDLATLYFARADYDRAMDINERRFSVLRDEFNHQRVDPVFFVDKLNDYGLVLRARGNTETAEQLLREALDVCDRYGLATQIEGVRTFLTLILLDRGKFDEAKSSQQLAVGRLRKLPEDKASQLPGALTLLGSIKMEKGELPEAQADLIEAEELYRQLFGPDFTAIYDNVRLQAQAAYLIGNFPVAERKIGMALENYRKTSNPKYISFATALTVQGLILNKLGRPSEAEAILREAVKLRMENLPESHFMTALTKGALGEVLLDEKKLDEAAPLIRSSYASLVASQKTENERLRLGKARLDRLESAISQNYTSH